MRTSARSSLILFQSNTQQWLHWRAFFNKAVCLLCTYHGVCLRISLRQFTQIHSYHSCLNFLKEKNTLVHEQRRVFEYFK